MRRRFEKIVFAGAAFDGKNMGFEVGKRRIFRVPGR